MIKPITANMHNCHFWVGTPNLFNIHTQAKIFIDDVLYIGKLTMKVTEVLLSQRSRIFPGLNFYEIRYETVS